MCVFCKTLLLLFLTFYMLRHTFKDERPVGWMSFLTVALALSISGEIVQTLQVYFTV